MARPKSERLAIYGSLRNPSSTGIFLAAIARRAATTANSYLVVSTATIGAATAVPAVGFEDVFPKIGLFFSTLAVVTVVGAYAVLAYMAQEAVQSYGWLDPGDMLDGLGMAETTRGR